ncbi:MAG TPA: hypothetical protein PLW48_07275 [Alphaproteobacteria bacterium]|nr:hypothetical protein [Alphaproteobacteria bacterium]
MTAGIHGIGLAPVGGGVKESATTSPTARRAIFAPRAQKPAHWQEHHAAAAFWSGGHERAACFRAAHITPACWQDARQIHIRLIVL